MENVQRKQCLQVPIQRLNVGSINQKGYSLRVPSTSPPTKEKWREGVQMLPLFIFHLSGGGGGGGGGRGGGGRVTAAMHGPKGLRTE